MTASPFDTRTVCDPEAHREDALYEQFLHTHGLDRLTLHTLPLEEIRQLEAAAAAFVSGRLAEIDARARYVHEIHDARL